MGDQLSQVMWPCTFTESAASDEGWGKKYNSGTVCKCVTEEREEDYTIRSGRLGLKGCIGITLQNLKCKAAQHSRSMDESGWLSFGSKSPLPCVVVSVQQDNMPGQKARSSVGKNFK